MAPDDSAHRGGLTHCGPDLRRSRYSGRSESVGPGPLGNWAATPGSVKVKFKIALRAGRRGFGCVCGGSMAAAACADGRMGSDESKRECGCGSFDARPGSTGGRSTGRRIIVECADGNIQHTGGCRRNTGQPDVLQDRVFERGGDGGSLGVVYAKAPESHLAGQRYHSRILPGPGDDKASRPLQARSCEPDRAVHGLWRNQEVHLTLRQAQRSRTSARRSWAWDGPYSLSPQD